MKLAIHPEIKDKNVADQRWFTEGWKNVEFTLDGLADHVNEGGPYTGQFEGRRKKENYLASDVLSVDIDGGATIEETLQHPLVATHGSLLYTTVNHSTTAHRFRVVFQTERTITDPREHSAATRALMTRLFGDPAATDPLRIYFGSTGCQPKILGRLLANSVLEELIAQGGINGPRSDSCVDESRIASSRSSLSIDDDMLLRTDRGEHISLSNIEPKTRVHCPFHADNRPSAFIVVTRMGQKGVHCSACHSTFYSKNDTTWAGFDFFDFEKCARSVTNRITGAQDNFDITRPEDFEAALRKARIKLSEEQHLQLYAINPGISFIKSPKGTGKTSTVVDVLPTTWTTEHVDLFGETHAEESTEKVLLIGHRQALIRDLCSKFHLNCYLDDESLTKQELTQRQQNYGVCLDSLLKLKPSRHTYDIIVIDEVEQVLAHFLSETMNKSRRRVFDYFAFLLKNAKRIVALDADLGWTSFHTITTLAGATSATGENSKPVWVYINDYKVADRHLELYRSEKHLIAEMLQSLREGKRTFVTSNSKAKIDALCVAIDEAFDKPIKRMVITSDNSSSPEAQDFIKNIKNDSLNYQVILTSPSLGTGIDITYPGNAEHVDVVYGFFENLINTHFDIDQQLSRVRHPKAVRVWISPRCFNFDTNVSVVKRDVLVTNFIANTYLGLDAHGNEVYADDDPFLNMASLIVAQQRASKNALRKQFIQLKQAQGWTVTEIAPEEVSEETSALIKRAKGIRDDRFADMLLRAKPIDQGTYLQLQERIEGNEYLTSEERSSLLRSSLEAFYRQPLSVDIVRLDKRGAYRDCIYLFEFFSDEKRMAHLRADLTILCASPKYMKQMTFVPDRRLRAQLLHELLQTTPLYSAGHFDVDVTISVDDLERFAKRIVELKRYVESILGVAVQRDVVKKPMQQLGRVLKLIGLSLEKRKTKKAAGEKVYIYGIDRTAFATLTTIVDARKRDADLPWRYVHSLHGFATALYARRNVDFETYQYSFLAPVEGGDAVPLKKIDKASQALDVNDPYNDFRRDRRGESPGAANDESQRKDKVA